MATLEALDLRSVRDEVTGCLRWQGAHTPKGYGQIHIDGRLRPVHRVAYERVFGEIPDGLEIDHVYARGCRHRDCIEPTHLEAVTHRENINRAAVRRNPGLALEVQACPRGHQFTEKNTRLEPDGHRFCRTCAAVFLSAKKSCPECGLLVSSRNMSRHRKVQHG